MSNLNLAGAKLIGVPSNEERAAHQEIFEREFFLFSRLVEQEYSRGRSEQLKAKDAKAKLNVELSMPMRVANAAVMAFYQAKYGPKPKKDDAQAASDLRKETEAQADEPKPEGRSSTIITE